ncbi:MAG: tetratricopeptide repeat protein, partial [Bryobacteraceae bacterium]
ASNLGQILMDRGDLAGARRQMERALRIFQNTYGLEDPRTINAQKAFKSLPE